MEMSLWGDEFSVKEEDVKEILKKSKGTKKEKTDTQIIKSKSVSIYTKLKLIEENVHRILGSYENETITIRTYEDLVKYIDRAVENGIISIDTETDNSLDTIQCKLMGLCIYTPGQKNAYVPVNHVNFEITENNEVIEKEKLDNQLTEEQIHTQLKRVINKNLKCIFTNAPFDIEVIYSTCTILLKPFWDTFSAAKVLDENELAGLKAQYKLHINNNQEKYDIEHLFQGLPYSIFKPELFALYAATDARMTYELYKYQLELFEKPENEGIYELFKTIEMPILNVIVGMELRGVTIDAEYAKAMSLEYHRRSDEIQKEIDQELEAISDQISAWRLSPEANDRKKVYVAKKTKLTKQEIIEKYPYAEKDGRRYKYNSKTPAQQLADPIELGSPTQLQILLYDILKAPVIDKSDPRGTGADILQELAEAHHIKICDLLIKKRGVDILINTFIDKMPELIRKKTGKLHARFNSYGAATGRFSSSDPNLQNIPSTSKEIRMMFKPGEEYNNVEFKDNYYDVNSTDDIKVSENNWKRVKDVSLGDTILNSMGQFDEVVKIEQFDKFYRIYVK